MTGGTVVVLGKTGRNFAAGMSGGIAYVYDEDGQFAKRCNTAMVSLDKVLSADEQAASVDRAIWHQGQADEELLKALIEQHHSWTGSLRAREILDDWAGARGKFVKVFPNEYKRALGEIHAKPTRPRTPPSPRPRASPRPPRPCRPSDPTQRTESGHSIMGKVTGFMEFERLEEGYEPVPQRLKNYKEFVIGLNAEQAKVQGARCMDCGTPFCNSGCPVNNIIPDFNDLVYRGDWAQCHHRAAQHQQLPRVHRPHLPGALRGRLHAQRQRRRGGHQEHRARHHRPRLGRGLGARRSRRRSRPARPWPSSAAARPAWPRRSSWRAPATA